MLKLNVEIISEPPYFLRRPEDTVAVAGTDVTLECQVSKVLSCNCQMDASNKENSVL